MARHENHCIAYFISPHGYGHAARAAGVMEALHELDPAIRFELFTKVPEWFFKDTIPGDFGYHPLLTDIGLVQKTPLIADISETLQRLDHFLPFDPSMIRDLAETAKERGCRLIICDIAPMGIAVAERSGIPSILVENFTWDWVYQEYMGSDGRLTVHIRYLKELFERADYHIQARPVCRPCNADLITLPISRKTRSPAGLIRKRLVIPDNIKAVLITMGGIQEQYPFLDKLTDFRDIHFIIPGSSEKMQASGNLLLLPHHSGYFHPDLLNACDAVIGKVGYSTLAEVYYAGIPFGYIARRDFKESKVLVSYIETHMKGLPIDDDSFYNGNWISCLPDLVALPRIQRRGPDGATQAARFIYGLLSTGTY